MKVAAVIPCYNEALKITNVVEKALRYCDLAIVIDDGSADNTGEIAKKAGAFVIMYGQNRGKGEAIKIGFNYILSRDDLDAGIIIDGDGQHDCSEIPDFAAVSQRENAAVVVGDRIGGKRPKEMPTVRWLTNKFMSFLLSKLIGQRVPDTQCGYKLIRKDAMKDLKIIASRYDIDSEVIIQSAKNGYKISSVPIKTIYQDEVSHIHPFRDTIRFIRLMYGAIRGK